MDGAELTAWVNAALVHVPKNSDYCTNKLRERLNSSFRKQLGSEPEHPSSWTVQQLVLHEIASLGCKPQYDSALYTLDWPPGH